MKKTLISLIILAISSISYSQVLFDSPCNYDSTNEFQAGDCGIQVSTAGFTSTYDIIGCDSVQTGINDGWFWYDGTGTQVEITFTPDAGFDGVIQVLEGTNLDPCSGYYPSECSNSAGNGGAETIIGGGVIGARYLVILENYNSNNSIIGSFCLSALPPTCDDGIQNGTETGVDCGGTCPGNCPPATVNSSNAPCNTSISPLGLLTCDVIGTPLFNEKSGMVILDGSNQIARPNMMGDCGDTTGSLYGTWAEWSIEDDIGAITFSAKQFTGSGDIFAAIYQGNDCNNLNFSECLLISEEFGMATYPKSNTISINSTDNLFIYFYSIYSFNGELFLRGSSNLAINESCDNAIFQQSGCNLGASSEDWAAPDNIPGLGKLCSGGNWYTNENTVYYEVLADSTQASIEVKNIYCNDGQIGFAQIGIWKHDCSFIGDDTSYTNGNFIACATGSGGATVSFPTIPGQEYYLVIDGNAGDICKWDIEYDHVYACETPLVFNVSKMYNCATDSFEIEVIGAKGTSDDWYLYTDTCGGTLVASSNDSSFILPNINQNYYVRGEHIDTSCTILGPCFNFNTTQYANDTTIVTNTYSGCDSVYYYTGFISSDTIIIDSIAGNGCLSVNIDTIIVNSSKETILPSITACDSAFIFDLWRHTSGTYSRVLQTALGCDSTISIYFNKIDSNNLNILEGKVFYQNSLISAGSVQLIHKPDNSPNSMIVVDEVSIKPDGSYQFLNVDSDLSTYLIRAQGDTSLYPDAVPTYYDTTNHWQKAKEINLTSCNDTILDLNIDLIDFPAIIGHGSMNGRVSNSGDKSGVEVSDISIFAFNKTTNDKFFAKTNAEGFFNISVTDGNYFITAEVLGYSIDSTFEIVINEDIQNVEIDICLDSIDNEVVICKLRIINSIDVLTQANINIHPNPVKNVFTISTNTENVITVDMVSIKDISGRSIPFEYQLEGKDILINLSEYEKGIYLVDIDGLIHKKIIKE